mmetsp:Transcript_19059/g.48807  ORF Transcript_19059/g.48807 Transcript_19059/m.48807 type:complete len:128 (+) Transcript_19059:53-436(+)|eukprot:CAMPEP_0115870350 /NCGR_PEP_ID=MMETSP0287-20121206/22280_1 /TAXON_ID=412157 /ORGANISM="Chrysochromulina rotalis, Strain UIO044" /LENGTH=127 /DNA_ID=CAMNT_0003325067 /DNA_START=27 /DNA_END=410 /DNA_ORIENTATION=-
MRCLSLAALIASATGLVISPAAHASHAIVTRAACPLMDEDGPLVGKCKWFNVEKGYGFIAVDGEDRDVFVHQSDIYAPGFRSLSEGETLEFRLSTDDKTGKVKAVDVTGPDGAYVQGAPKQMEDDYY